MPWRGSYVASKFALEGLTHTLRIEMRDTPIHVILIEPGPITTKFGKIPYRILKNGLIEFLIAQRAI